MKRILILTFNGCEEIELFAVMDILSRCGVEVDVVSAFDEELIATRSGFGFDYSSYAKFGYMALDDGYDAFYMPGGAIEEDFTEFTSEYGDYLVEQLHEFGKSGGIISANCIAPALLAKIGAFDFKSDHKVVCYPGTEKGNVKKEHLAYADNAKLTEPKVHIDGNIITGNGPAASAELAFTLAEHLTNSQTVSNVRKNMLY